MKSLRAHFEFLKSRKTTPRLIRSRAQRRVIVKRILRNHGYPPGKQEKTTRTVLEQVELLCWEVST
jgi:hypothetical protein